MRTSRTAAIFFLASTVLLAAGEPPEDAPMPDETQDRSAFRKPPERELKTTLSPLQYEVTQQCGTEPPFDNAYWNNHAHGLYVDVVSGEPLFSSLDKYDSGSGWPSFTKPVAATALRTLPDHTLWMPRVEVRSAAADSHLGHVFEDGPSPGGLRYCINSAALRFVPVSQLEAEGYGAFLPTFAAAGVDTAQAPKAAAPSAAVRRTEVALLAGGCFWGMEGILREVPGVIDTEVGYTGGRTENADYASVRTGRTGHAEAIRVEFDPAVVSYESLLRLFFRMHDPTTENRQGGDVGTQYRSAIFAADDAQRETAERVRTEVDASGFWSDPVVTEIEMASAFWPAEGYHQDYLEKNPGGYTCHWVRE